MLPTYQGLDNADGGIRRVIEALQTGLPAHGIEVTATPDGADLIACHGTLWDERPGMPVVSHNHGAYWREYQFPPWAERANGAIRDALTRCDAATVPSQWVKRAYQRAIWTPTEVIYHGVDPEAWEHDDDDLGYVLWNKARVDPVSDPAIVGRLASLMPEQQFVTTFGHDAANVKVIGAAPHSMMHAVIQRAGVYLATARETFGIGTLEALASGVPVVGWNYGGQAEIVVSGVTGMLVTPGDDAALADAIRWVRGNRAALSANARADVRARWRWDDRIADYAALYRRVASRPRPTYRAAIVITTYNLNQYLPDALRSALRQGDDVQVIVVDDAGEQRAEDITREYPSPRLQLLRTDANGGLSAARNAGAALTDARYLLFLDADDELPEGTVHRLADAMDADRSLHIAAGRLETMNHEGRDRRLNPWPSMIDYRLQMSHLNQLHYAALWRRETFVRTGGFRVRDWRAEDAAHWCRAIGFGARAELVTDSVTLSYRMRPDSKSRVEAQRFQDRDGDWTRWYPWRTGASSGPAGAELAHQGVKLDPRLTPFAAPVTPPRACYPISHREHPAVSVIIPCGPGHEHFLVDALDSVLAQTFDNWECLVCNDTGEQIDTSAHAWVRMVDTAGRQGAGAARNCGVRSARAPLVLFLDADDMLAPDALRVLLEAYAENDVAYTYGDWALWKAGEHVDGDLEYKPCADFEQLDALSRGYTEGRRMGHSVTALVETEAARAVLFDEALPGWEDTEFFLHLAAEGYCGLRVPALTLYYRLGTGSRREAAHANADRLRAQLAAKYQPYTEGRMPKSCCGGRATIRQELQPQLDDVSAILPLGGDEATAIDGRVRMRYVGPHQGEHSIFGRGSGEVYRVGNNPYNRYANVAVGDVEDLLTRRDEVGEPLFEVMR